MADHVRTTTIHGRTCHLYQKINHSGAISGTMHIRPHLPVFYWGINRDSKASVLTAVSYLKTHRPNASFLLAAYETESWNDDFSPWAAEAVFGTEAFGGKGEDTFKWLAAYCMPYIEAKMCEIARFPVGYSLAGLFSLWVYCKSELFAGAVSCSGSLWYEGWLEYVRKQSIAARNNEREYIYISLGDREHKTKNKRMSAVGDCTKETYALLCGHQAYQKGILAWNHGGHFAEPDLRVAKGIDWILRQFDV
ncbi:MAG: alpha/beta hydrolase [Lachnospiraceae bacterium]|nr:alpha/beta hydrolase [Lachnospiraceae bacterium]